VNARDETPAYGAAAIDRLPRGSAYAGILLCSVAILMQEILLTRIFSLTIWYHFAYLTISTALLGFGAAGSLLVAKPSLLARDPGMLAARAAAGAGVSLLVALWLLGPRPIDPGALLHAPLATSIGLLGYYAVVAVPFFFGGLAVATPLSAHPRRANRLYAADLLGAGLGCAAAVAALTWGDGEGAAAICAGIFLLAAASYAGAGGARAGFALAGVALFAASPLADRALEFRPVASKALGAALRQPGIEVLHSQWSPINRVDLYRIPDQRISWWAAFGQSPTFRGTPPRIMSIQYDGHNGSDAQQVSGPDALAMLDSHLLRTPYLLLERPAVLVIGVGGGIDVQNALRRDARRVVGVDLQPITVKLHETLLADWTGLPRHPQLELVASEGRHYVHSHDEVFDLVQITAVDTFSAQSTGAYVLAESYLYTVEAFEAYLSRLSEDGVLCIVLGDPVFDDPRLPPPLAARLAMIGDQALRNGGVARPAEHLLMLSHERAVDDLPTPEGYMQALLVKKRPFAAEQIAALRRFADEMGFEVRLAPDAGRDPALQRLVHAAPDERPVALASQPFVVTPSTDDRPFFFNVLPWTSLVTGERIHWMFPGSATGQLMLILMLVQSLLVGSALILLPLLRTGVGSLGAARRFGFFLYFLSLGLGFMLVEISFVQKYVLILGYPTYSLSVTILSLLVFAALGAALCQRGWGAPKRFLRALLAVTAGFVALEVALLPWLREAALGLSLPARIALTVAMQLPLGIALGMYFPTGLELLRRSEPQLVPWAWAINGIASVVATVLAVILGMQIGFSAVAGVAIAIYAGGTLALLAALPASAAAD
jgi:hypothetical protein